MDKQIERAGDDNKNNIGVLYGIGVGPPGDPLPLTKPQSGPSRARRRRL